MDKKARDVPLNHPDFIKSKPLTKKERDQLVNDIIVEKVKEKTKDLPIITGELPSEDKPRLAIKGEIVRLHGLFYDVTFVNRNTGHVRMKLKKERI